MWRVADGDPRSGSLRDGRTTLVNMGQILPFIAATTTIVGVMVGLLIRSMSAQRAELSAKIDGTHEKIDGLRSEMNAKFERTDDRIDGLRIEMNAKFERTHDRIDGLRNEMNARLEPLGRLVDRLDEDVRELGKKVANSGQPHST
jgi:uncharacterized membrane-anchored protein YhcB (DUF1043 family)